MVDDAAVNAFAIPGGHIYVTRGLLAQLESEAELAMVMGHEVGHVTARHTANQLSKQQLATLGFGIGMIAVPSLQRFGDLGQTALGLMFLKFGRDDEREADDLGLRYAGRLGYEPEQAAQAMAMLDMVSRQHSEGRMPGWLSTHPDPGDRYQTLVKKIREQNLTGEQVNREGYLRRARRADVRRRPARGLLPRGHLLPPRAEVPAAGAARLQDAEHEAVGRRDEPRGRRHRAAHAGPGQLRRAGGPRPVRQANVQPNLQRTEINGLPAVAGTFQAASGQTAINGVAAFVELENRVYQLLGYTASGDWNRYGRTLSSAVQSFGPLRERWAFEVQPKRLKLVNVDRNLSVAEFARRYPSTVPVDTVALLNQVEPTGTLKAGQLAKQVVGGSMTQAASLEP